MNDIISYKGYQITLFYTQFHDNPIKHPISYIIFNDVGEVVKEKSISGTYQEIEKEAKEFVDSINEQPVDN